MKVFMRELRGALLIIIGTLSAGLGIKGFLVPSGFIDGGATGTSMLISALSGAPLYALILLINIPFVLVGYRQISRVFAFKSALAIGAFALCLAVVKFPDVTDDKLLTAVFGGFFLGAGIGLAIRGNAVLDGTEIAALLLSKRFGGTVGDVILAFNVVIFSVAAVLLGVETALYSMLTYFAAARTIDFFLHGIEEYNGVIIISARSEEIKTSIINDMNRGVTVYKGRGGLSEARQDILFCVVTRLELHKLRRIVEETDPAAFVVIHPISDTVGGVVKRRVSH